MAKTEVFRWRLDPSTKAALEDAARQRKANLAEILDEIVEEWLSRRVTESGADEQRALHRAARRYIGAIEGGDPHRAETSRERLRSKGRRPGA